MLCHHFILCREWRIIVEFSFLLLIKYRPIIMVGLWCLSQSDVTELLSMRDPHWGVLNQLKPSELYIFSCGKGRCLYHS